MTFEEKLKLKEMIPQGATCEHSINWIGGSTNGDFCKVCHKFCFTAKPLNLFPLYLLKIVEGLLQEPATQHRL